MNILILAAMDCSGAGHALMTAINEHTGHKARMIATRQVRYRYPVDIVNPSKAELHAWVNWADVLNLHVRGEDMIPDGALKRPAVKTYHGSEYRSPSRAKEENDKAQVGGWLQTCLTLDLSQHGTPWIGRAMPDLSHMLNQSPDEFRIVHAAAPDRKGKKNRKGTDILEAVLEGMEGITVDIFRELPNAECLERKARAHLYIDQVGPRSLVGHGTNSLEAFAMGIPVVSSAPPAVLESIKQRVGYLPFCPSHGTHSGHDGMRELRRRIKQFRDLPWLCQKWAKRGQRYVRRWHSQAYVAGEYVKLFERVANR